MATRTVSLDWLFTARASAAPGAVLLAMVLGVGVVQPSFLSVYSKRRLGPTALMS